MLYPSSNFNSYFNEEPANPIVKQSRYTGTSKRTKEVIYKTSAEFEILAAQCRNTAYSRRKFVYIDELIERQSYY